MMKRFLKQTSREYSLPVRLAVTMGVGSVLALIIPMSLLLWASQLDDVLGWKSFSPGLAGWIVGGLLMICGFGFAFWSISDQLFKARGTPIPVVATQELLVTGPFRLCRNPMTLGAIMAYMGLAILTGSLASILGAVLFAALLFLYLKGFEEKELEARFGESYRAYRVSTPFIIPRLGKPKQHEK